MKSITKEKLKCPKCNLVSKVKDCLCEGEITPKDDDGNLCCPKCWYVMKDKQIMSLIR